MPFSLGYGIQFSNKARPASRTGRRERMVLVTTAPEELGSPSHVGFFTKGITSQRSTFSRSRASTRSPPPQKLLHAKPDLLFCGHGKIPFKGIEITHSGTWNDLGRQEALVNVVARWSNPRRVRKDFASLL
jgi:hypothetical protein